ncbi:MAG: RNA methyltransferase [Planctomycetaceae bacterium]
MPEFVHVRHKPPAPLERPRELVVACSPLKSNINLSRIVRAAGCSGVTKVYATGSGRLDRNIARDGAEAVEIDTHRSLAPVLKQLKIDGYRLVGLEQTTNSQSLCEFRFDRRTCLVIGNERLGLTKDLLALLDEVVEIPMYGVPHSHNVATATAIAVYEYCRQFPLG